MAEGNVHVAAVELAGQAAAVERSDGVGAAGSPPVRWARRQKHKNAVANGYLYRCRRLGSSSVLRKYLEHIRRLWICSSELQDAAKNLKTENILHEVLVVVVGQDSGDVPVPRGEGLEDVRAGVGLEEHQRLDGGEGWTAGDFCMCVTRKVDMEMWKNFPLPP